MQFKRSLTGAVIGGAIGIAILMAAHFLFGTEHTALAIVVALAVGFGVRSMVSTRGHASYARGALTALLAIAAFVGGKLVIAEVAARQMTAFAQQPVRPSDPAPQPSEPADAQPAGESSDSASSAVSEPAEPAQRDVQLSDQSERPRIGEPLRNRPPAKVALSTWDFIWLTVAALVAYELGRGSGTSQLVDPGIANATAV
jgi:hypothetical protein